MAHHPNKIRSVDTCNLVRISEKRPLRSIKLLISKGKLTLDAIETIKANVSSVVLRFIYDSDDDDDEVNALIC